MYPNASFGAYKTPPNVIKSAFGGVFSLYLYNILYKVQKPWYTLLFKIRSASKNE